jgi:hypothetical protein
MAETSARVWQIGENECVVLGVESHFSALWR